MLEELIVRHQIEVALVRLARALDERDWAALETILAEDCTGDFGENHILRSRTELVAMFDRYLGRCGPTQHLLGNLLVERRGDCALSHVYVRACHMSAGKEL